MATHSRQGSGFPPAGFFEREHSPIIVHSHLRCDVVWKHPQQTIFRLAAHHPILFLEEPVWREGEPRLEISRPDPSIVRVTPALPPWEPTMNIDDQCALSLLLLDELLWNGWSGRPDLNR